MKYFIASDLHGSSYYANQLKNAFERENAHTLILLGDIYNHGPRNPLPKDYAPLKVAEVLNGLKDKLLVVKGNCDSEVDTLISDFDFITDLCLETNGKSVFLTHGHVYNKEHMPKTKFNAVIYGHFHTGFIIEQNEVVVANAGSLSLPKDGTANSYIIVEDGVLTLKDIDGNIIDQKVL